MLAKILYLACFLGSWASRSIDVRRTVLIEEDMMPPGSTLGLVSLKTLSSLNMTLLECTMACHMMTSCRSISYGKSCDCVLWAERYGENDNLLEEKIGCNFYYVYSQAQTESSNANGKSTTAKPKTYFVIKTAVNYTEAVKLCQQNNSRLLCIHDVKQQRESLKVESQQYKANQHLWVGLKGVNKKGIFRWTDGKTLYIPDMQKYHNQWSPLPNNYKTNLENSCLRFGYVAGYWSEQPCKDLYYPFCEEI